MKRISKKIHTQDFKQRVTVTINCIIELYRVITSSLIILFVPQNCVTPPPAHVCSLKENIQFDSAYYNTVLVFNFITLFSFLVMYGFEMHRENLLIKYLDVNNTLPTDNEDVGKVLELLPQKNKIGILKSDLGYQRSGYSAMFIFVVNAFLSGFCLYDYYLNNQTTTTFVTYLLFMVIKISSVWVIIHTPKNIFYSSYLKTNVQYNDIDEDLKTVNLTI